jgi:hypothetical protein
MSTTSTTEFSIKLLGIGKANAQMVAAIAIASFVTVFCLVASQSLWSTQRYQSRVIAAKEKANTQLKANEKAVDSLVASYKSFVTTGNNVLGGSINGTGDNDGDNAKIVLDALPSKYDFPALTSSLEKIFKDQNLNVTSITGTDDEVAQSATASSASPATVTMPFSFTISNASYSSVQNLISILQRSIRPISIDSLTLAGGANDMQFTVNAHTYYQPGKDLSITKQVVR